MNSARSVASVIFFALSCAGHAGEHEPGDPATGEAPAARPRNTSPAASIKSTAREIGNGIKRGARQIKDGIKSGALQVKRGVAVARCNDGEYSYTHHRTCNHHGGVREQLR